MSCAFGTGSEQELLAARRRSPAHSAWTSSPRSRPARRTLPACKVPGADLRRAYDFGVKRPPCATSSGSRTSRSSLRRPRGEVLAAPSDGVFLSNVPGTRAAPRPRRAGDSALCSTRSPCSDCLGHQLLARALGAQNYNCASGTTAAITRSTARETGAVEITSQNHGYAVADGTLTGAAVSHVNLNDGRHRGPPLHRCRAFSVSNQPRGGPGPHDARYLFEEFPGAPWRLAEWAGATTSRRSSSSLRPDRHRPGLRVRTTRAPRPAGLLREEGYRVIWRTRTRPRS